MNFKIRVSNYVWFCLFLFALLFFWVLGVWRGWGVTVIIYSVFLPSSRVWAHGMAPPIDIHINFRMPLTPQESQHTGHSLDSPLDYRQRNITPSVSTSTLNVTTLLSALRWARRFTSSMSCIFIFNVYIEKPGQSCTGVSYISPKTWRIVGTDCRYHNLNKFADPFGFNFLKRLRDSAQVAIM